LQRKSHLSPEQAELVARAAATIAERAHEVDKKGVFPVENFELLGELGVLNYCIPKKYGGWGGGAGGDIGLFVETVLEISKACSSTGQGLAVHAHTCSQLNLYATEAQQERFAKEVIDKHVVFCGLGSEPTQRLRPDGTRLGYDTVARPTESGWIVSGRKFFGTNSPGATWLLVAASTEIDGVDYVTLPMVHADAPGLVVNDDWDNMGQRATGSGSVELNDIEIPADQMIGEPGQMYTHGALLHGVLQISFATELLGMALGALDFAKYWLHHEAKAPVGLASLTEDPHVQRLIGELEVAVAACRALLFVASDELQASQDSGDDGTAARDAVIRSKVLITETVVRVTSDIFQVCGARATASRFGTDRFWRNARTLTLHDVLDRQRATIGRRALGIADAPTVFEAARTRDAAPASSS
jgi:alkylation response protein AidB-like acyl-CoA dehydrogenase